MDQPAWQIALVVLSGLLSGVAAYEYAKFRARSAAGSTAPSVISDDATRERSSQVERGERVVSRPTATVTRGTTGIDQSSTHIDQSQRVKYITIHSPTMPTSRRNGLWQGLVDDLDQRAAKAGIAGVLATLIIVAFIVRAILANLANLYVDVRPAALFVLVLLGSTTTGLAFGAWLGLRQNRDLDRSWRRPLIAGAGVSLITFVTMWSLSHPLLRTGSLPELLRMFQGNDGGVLARASQDQDATDFLAFQAIGLALAVLTCFAALGLIVVVWANVEAQLPDKSWFVFAGLHRLFRRVPADRLLAALIIPAAGAALFASGVLHWVGGRGLDTEPPTLLEFRSAVGADEIHIRTRVDEPVVLRAVVRRLHRDGSRGLRLGNAARDCRPGRMCKLAFTSRPDSGPLAPGRYELRVRATDEEGMRSRLRTRRFRVSIAPRA